MAFSLLCMVSAEEERPVPVYGRLEALDERRRVHASSTGSTINRVMTTPPRQ